MGPQPPAPAGPRLLIGQFLRFAAVGVANTATAYLVIRLVQPLAGITLASLVGYALATAQSYLLNRLWTFAATRPQVAGRWRGEALRFVAVNALNAAVFSAVTTWLAPLAGMAVATLAGVALITPLGFILNRLLVFC